MLKVIHYQHRVKCHCKGKCVKAEKVRLRKQIIEHMNSLSEEQYTTLSEQIAFSLYAQKSGLKLKQLELLFQWKMK